MYMIKFYIVFQISTNEDLVEESLIWMLSLAVYVVELVGLLFVRMVLLQSSLSVV